MDILFQPFLEHFSKNLPLCKCPWIADSLELKKTLVIQWLRWIAPQRMTEILTGLNSSNDDKIKHYVQAPYNFNEGGSAWGEGKGYQKKSS